MAFIWVEALWLTGLLPLLVGSYVLLARRRQKTVLLYSAFAIVQEARSHREWLHRHAPPCLLLLAIIALLIAAARPVVPTLAAAEQRTIVLAIDVSMSMAATDIAPSRIAAAQAAARSFVDAQPRDVKIGVLAFAGNADLVQAPTRDRNALRTAIDNLRLEYNTAVGSAILAALLTIHPDESIAPGHDLFGAGRSPLVPTAFRKERKAVVNTNKPVAAGSNRSAAIVVLTDGRSTSGLSPPVVAHKAAALGVPVYTVGFGKRAGAKLDFDGGMADVDLDEEPLREAAAISGGEYFHAASASGLSEVYRALRGRIVLERREVELAPLIAAGALALALLAATLSLLWSPKLAARC